ncbi:fimbrillin family protein [Phocaeicola vulgatus]|uniref:Fimbrillin family protein n=1 Tax=Phocaeicola vulgatus TaxID=821 RepID=A0AAP3JZU3_PHOVU|nr:fimbrillin family protein [Phocaeicola vulgatus]MDB0827910.1 fimbrillin family protein [Phocaeicola vulgatus]MDB0845129.1 fimbrillin family protein [Phocaeicola vulgatus]MDB0849367.1 fimbrillin family protein [Phocaeicola vulgatus]MDB0853663.1 fimbrillin family protein [Phocaeicola vulgatus]MDB0874980.1 fimbrillin family protein [Phocaeicola vulgatus]
MKKIFLIGLAATAMLASCSNDETVEMAQQKAIGFSNAFVNNGTRSIVDPSFTTTSLEDFAVYGFTQNGQIFKGDKVHKGGSASTGWSYDALQYWVPGNTYTFGAIAPYSVATNVSNVALPENATKVEMTVAFTNTDADQVDLLHAAPTQIAGTEVTETYKTPVPMTFSHQLSKVKFSFKNAVGKGYNVKVSNVKITDAYTNGTLTVAVAGNTWSNQASNTLELDFGNVVADDATADEAAFIANDATLESYNEMLMIPTDNTAEYTVTFDAYLYQGDVLLNKDGVAYSHTTTIKGVELKLGYCYDFKATLTHENIVDPENPLKPIKFTVDGVEDWNQDEVEQTLDVPTTQSGN